MVDQEIKIILKTSHFVLVEKQSGWLSVPSRLGQKDNRPVLGLKLQEKLKQQIYPVHRLDFEVSGVMIFALNPGAQKIANDWFEKKKIKKVYYALTTFSHADEFNQKYYNKELFIPSPEKNKILTWKSKILRGKKRSYESTSGLDSITQAEYLEKSTDPASKKFNKFGDLGKEIFLWRLNPITGRSHQLRLELSRHGHPIIGDELYGSPIKLAQGQIGLTAEELIFPESECQDWELPKKIIFGGN